MSSPEITWTLVAAGYAVHAINPLSVDRYRDRLRTSGAKSDPGDARVLARAHQGLIWSRQRHLNQLRNALREFYPAALSAFGTDLASPDALAVLALAPTPAEGRSLSPARIAVALRRSGRRRRVMERAEEIQRALRSTQLQAPEVLARAYREVVRSNVAIVVEVTGQIEALAQELETRFEEHPDGEILRSLPGLGVVLGARVLAEFGDDPTRYPRDVGVLLTHRLPRRTALLRRPPGQGPDQPAGPPLAREPMGGDPPRLSAVPTALLGTDRLAHGRGSRSLTATGRGMSSWAPGAHGSSFSGWSPMRQTGSDAIDSPR